MWKRKSRKEEKYKKIKEKLLRKKKVTLLVKGSVLLWKKEKNIYVYPTRALSIGHNYIIMQKKKPQFYEHWVGTWLFRWITKYLNTSYFRWLVLQELHLEKCQYVHKYKASSIELHGKQRLFNFC